jgi:hypothetical protein
MIRHHLLARAASGAALVLTATFGAACTPSATPAPTDASGTASFGPNDLAPGTHVTVNKNGQWLPATIAQPLGGDRFIVAYDGFGPQWNEAVGLDRIKAGAAVAPAGYLAGDKVLITSQGRVVLGDVLQQVAAGTWRVHYDGYGPEAAENVTEDRLQHPFRGVSAHAVGEAVMVEANGQTLPAKILAASAQNRWLVRFDGYNPQYDQEVRAERIHAAPPPPPPPVAVAPAPVAVVAPPPVIAPPVVEPPAKPEKDKGKKVKAKPEPVAPPVAAAPAAPAPLQVGDTVLVSQRGSWVRATITGPGASPGQWKIKYEGATAEEEVTVERAQQLGALAKGSRFNAGQPVMVEWHGVFVPGKVLKEEGKGFYRIRFDGQGPESDEVVPVKRLHPR